MPNSTGQVERIHFLGAITIPIDSYHSSVMSWGAEIDVTDEVRELSVDRNGNSWLDLLGDDEAQVRRYGEVFFRPGPWPANLPRLRPGSDAWKDAREAARQAAHRLSYEPDRKVALAEVEREFGPALATNQTLATIRGDGE
ncbi:hypothetical protein E3T54_15010 [Cryobacterium sp. Sr8]|uniref:hypothetical protein n=1 Tax=Cryobacterium sp. Sr8 TaxID=1259203 RepID=UPI00106CF788|nr:hypothetical protein [Cryobacterium sp. Sr8]TFD74107.1 hypothetical protein E3T54_15010 [Cryobacterium sp. Sr8]